MSVSAQGNDIEIKLTCKEAGVIESLSGATSVILRLVQGNVAVLEIPCADAYTGDDYTSDFANGIVVAVITAAQSNALAVGSYYLDLRAVVGGKVQTWDVDVWTPNTLRIKAAVETS